MYNYILVCDFCRRACQQGQLTHLVSIWTGQDARARHFVRCFLTSCTEHVLRFPFSVFESLAHEYCTFVNKLIPLLFYISPEVLNFCVSNFLSRKKAHRTLFPYLGTTAKSVKKPAHIAKLVHVRVLFTPAAIFSRAFLWWGAAAKIALSDFLVLETGTNACTRRVRFSFPGSKF